MMPGRGDACQVPWSQCAYWAGHDALEGPQLTSYPSSGASNSSPYHPRIPSSLLSQRNFDADSRNHTLFSISLSSFTVLHSLHSPSIQAIILQSCR